MPRLSSARQRSWGRAPSDCTWCFFVKPASTTAPQQGSHPAEHGMTHQQQRQANLPHPWSANGLFKPNTHKPDTHTQTPCCKLASMPTHHHITPVLLVAAPVTPVRHPGGHTSKPACRWWCNCRQHQHQCRSGQEVGHGQAANPSTLVSCSHPPAPPACFLSHVPRPGARASLAAIRTQPDHQVSCSCAAPDTATRLAAAGGAAAGVVRLRLLVLLLRRALGRSRFHHPRNLLPHILRPRWTPHKQATGWWIQLPAAPPGLLPRWRVAHVDPTTPNIHLLCSLLSSSLLLLLLLFSWRKREKGEEGHQHRRRVPGGLHPQRRLHTASVKALVVPLPPTSGVRSALLPLAYTSSTALSNLGQEVAGTTKVGRVDG